jgi:predicted nucleic acid-binding protein
MVHGQVHELDLVGAQRLAGEESGHGFLVEIIQNIRACRDPKDDAFLEVAVNGSANLIVSGDRDLLSLHLFRGIDILSPAAYLDRAA